MGKQERRKFRPQLTLRMMLIVVTLVAIGFAYDRRYRRQHQAAQQLRQANKARVSYHRSLAPWLPIAGDLLRDVEAVDLSHCRVDEETFKLLLRFPRIQRLYIARAGVTNDDLALIGKLRSLKRLSLWHNAIDGRGIEKLANLKQLEVLDVHGNRLHERSLETFAKFPRLHTLMSDISELTDKGISHWASMRAQQLGEVQLRYVTDAGLRLWRTSIQRTTESRASKIRRSVMKL